MKWLSLFLSLFLLSSCATHTVSHNLADNTINQITALEQSIDKNCITDGVKTQINTIKSQIKAINGACDIEKKQITAEKNKYKIAFWSLVIVLGVFLIKKVATKD